MGVTYPNLGYAILGTLIALAFASIVVFVIELFIPELIGKKRTKELPFFNNITRKE